jgi:hypothetical protein
MYVKSFLSLLSILQSRKCLSKDLGIIEGDSTTVSQVLRLTSLGTEEQTQEEEHLQTSLPKMITSIAKLKTV